jgi:hypothetical protein
MTFITTIVGIMTAPIFVWNPDEQSEDELIAYAHDKTYDTVPIRRNGRFEGLFHVETRAVKPITHDLLITRDTPIHDGLDFLSNSQHPSLLVLYRQHIEGIVTPSDFNKVIARSYFYNLRAQLEMLLAERARAFYENEDDIVALIKPDDKTLAQFRREIRDRSSGTDRRKFNLDLVHSLMLSEMEALVFKDETFRLSLHLSTRDEAERLFSNINKEFRRKVMHPTRPLLSDDEGIEQLSQQVQQVIQLVELLKK